MAKAEHGRSVQATIVNPLGLHARSAAKIAQIARQAKGKVRVECNRSQVDAKDMLDLLTIACPRGTTITVKIDDLRDTEILEALVELIGSGFGETF